MLGKVETLKAVLALLHLPHRGSATPEEAEAFRRLRAFLEARGEAVETLPFRGVRSYGPELLGISLLLALSPLFPPSSPSLGPWPSSSTFRGIGLGASSWTATPRKTSWPGRAREKGP